MSALSGECLDVPDQALIGRTLELGAEELAEIRPFVLLEQCFVGLFYHGVLGWLVRLFLGPHAVYAGPDDCSQRGLEFDVLGGNLPD
jgi:hypothetical protein